MLYLDHNATTPIDPEVAKAMLACYADETANAASQHGLGRRSRRLLESCREEIAQFVGADIARVGGPQLIFTSGGTESNNLSLFGLAGQPHGRVIVSSIEHPSVANVADELQRRGFDVHRLPVSTHGIVSLASLEPLLTSDTRLVSVMMGNNETGVLQPIEEISSLCRARGVPFHCDAVQAIGKWPVNFEALGLSAMSLTAHKLHGPQGIGALVVSSETELTPMMFGGAQQMGLRPGTESVALAVGMREAIRQWAREGSDRRAVMRELRDEFEASIVDSLPDTIVIGQGADRLPQTSNLAFPGLDRQALLIALDLAGVACSTGSTCSSGSSQPSPVLRAMGLPPEVIEGALRFSLGADTTNRLTAEAARRIVQVVNDLRLKKGTRKTPSTSRH